MRWILAACITTCLPGVALSTTAETPIVGGLGHLFDEPMPPHTMGAELIHSQLPGFFQLNPSLQLVQSQTTMQSSRLMRTYTLPHPLRSISSLGIVQVDDRDHPIRLTAVIQTAECEQHMPWLINTLRKKYNPVSELIAEPLETYEQSISLQFAGRSILVACGRELVIDYRDEAAISQWRERMARDAAKTRREDLAIAQRKMVLQRRRAIRFADLMTVGDRFRLNGAFGIEFQQPFAPKSAQQFPVDQPFLVAIPGLPPPFAGHELEVEIGPNRLPISIRGRFEGLDFDQIKEALGAKYGTPIKATERHVIHKVSGNHAILKRLDPRTIELAFIDTKAQEAKRQRAWAIESEGL